MEDSVVGRVKLPKKANRIGKEEEKSANQSILFGISKVKVVSMFTTYSEV